MSSKDVANTANLKRMNPCLHVPELLKPKVYFKTISLDPYRIEDRYFTLMARICDALQGWWKYAIFHLFSSNRKTWMSSGGDVIASAHSRTSSKPVDGSTE